MSQFYDDAFATASYAIGADTQHIADQLRKLRYPIETRELMSQWSLAPAFNGLGLPGRYQPLRQTTLNFQTISLCARYELYEKIGFISPTLLFSSPGPGMAAFVVAGLGTEQQQDAFFSRFQQELCWSCFAMTEPAQGSDAGAMQTTATAVEGGFLISGEKMFIGNGMIADTGVLFARTAPGPLGINAFVFNPQRREITRRALALAGLEGINLAQMRFDNLFIPNGDLLGRHLKPTQRFARSAMATFDALRPCVGALALGVARRALHEWQTALVPTQSQSQRLSRTHLRWHAAYRNALQTCRQIEGKQAPDENPGMVKTTCVILAEEIISMLIHNLPEEISPLHTTLWRAFRDVKAFEYTEGTRQIHRLNQGFSADQGKCECR